MRKSMKMDGSFLIDTNIIIDFFKGDQSIGIKLLKEEVFIPSIVIGELYFGAFGSGVVRNRMKRFKEIEIFSDSYPILEVSGSTALIYGDIKSQLKSMGKPIPENDIWIAALALEHNLILVSSDQHFSQIKKLETSTW